MSNDDMVIAAIVAVFVVFMVTLGSVAWWSNQAPRARKAIARRSDRNDMGGALSASR